MSETEQNLRPSPRAAEDVWDEYLSNNIVWADEVTGYKFNANAFVKTKKEAKVVEVFVELNNCRGHRLTLQAVVYNIHNRIVDCCNICLEKRIIGFAVVTCFMTINCPISKIGKIVIAGKVNCDDLETE